MRKDNLSRFLLGTFLIFLPQSGSAGEASNLFLSAQEKPIVRQAAGPTGKGDWYALQALPVGTELRLSLEGVRTVRGKLVSVAEDALTLQVSKKGTLAVARSEVIRVHAVRHDSITNGLLLGLAIGGGAGGVVGAITGAHSDFVATFTVPVALAIGAGLGTAIGAAADSARLEYELIYERPSPKLDPQETTSN